MRGIYKGAEVRLLEDKSGDLPKRYVGKKGLVVKRGKAEDGMQTWHVLFLRRKQPLICWRDELEVIQ